MFKRGEGYVVAQVAILAIVFFAPRTLPWLPPWNPAIARVAAVIGLILMILGGAFLFAAAFRLGIRTVTPVPHPRDSGTLAQTGPYRIVRHPMYTGALAFCYGWGLFVHGWLTLLYVIGMHVFANIKADREERWLMERYADYADYKRRTPKLIPYPTPRGR